MAVNSPVTPAPVVVNKAEVPVSVDDVNPPSTKANSNDQIHNIVFIVFVVVGVLLGTYGAVLSTGLYGSAQVDRLFEFATFLLANAGFLKVVPAVLSK